MGLQCEIPADSSVNFSPTPPGKQESSSEKLLEVAYRMHETEVEWLHIDWGRGEVIDMVLFCFVLMFFFLFGF